MAQQATTFRFDDDVREQLEEIRESFGFKTLSQTVEYMTRTYLNMTKEIRELRSQNAGLKTSDQERKNAIQRYFDSMDALKKVWS